MIQTDNTLGNSVRKYDIELSSELYIDLLRELNTELYSELYRVLGGELDRELRRGLDN